MKPETFSRPEFARALFGYRRRDVDVAFAEWRMLLRQLTERGETAEAGLIAAEAAARSALAEAQELRLREGELTRIAIEAQRNADEQLRRAEAQAAELERAAAARAREILASAEEKAASMRLEISRRSNETSAEIDELLRLRETLRSSVHNLTSEVAQALARVEHGDVAASVRPPEPVVPSARPLPAPATDRADLPAASTLFDTQVEVDAGPFPDFAALSTFERALGRVEHVQDVYIRRFADERATIEVTFSRPVDLIAGLTSVIPHAFEVVEARDSTLRLDLVAPLAGVGW